AKAIAYIDTVMEYLNPRINYCLSLTSTGLNTPEYVQNGLILAPNPMDQGTLISTIGKEEIRSVHVFDITGKCVIQQNGIGLASYRIDREGLDAGVYLVQVETALARYSQRLVIR
ncbi:MAG: T9SS type A sorting domain-containing protein, partial [Bacteroidota bacterium]